MFRMGPVHARDNGPKVFGAELERTARYRDLLYARVGIGYRRSIEIGLELVHTRQE